MVKKTFKNSAFLGIFLIFLAISAIIHFSGNGASQPASIPWPPVIGKPYPDLKLIDQEGKAFSLSDFRGRIIIVEPVGMTCSACQAFSGGGKLGPLGISAVQGGLPSFRELLWSYGRVRLPHPDITFVQILLYDLRMGVPKAEDAAVWAEHFQLEKKNNEIVAVSPADMRGTASYNLIPGFQLIDRNFVLRSDSTGHNPRDNPYSTFAPMVSRLLKE